MNTDQPPKEPCFAGPEATKEITAVFHSDGDHSDAFPDEDGGIRRRFTGAFKAAVVLKALEGKQSIQELAEQHNLHPNQIRNWKSLFRKRLPYLFEDRRLCNPGRRNALLLHEDIAPDEGLNQ